MRRQTQFTFRNAVITIQSLVVRDELRADILTQRLRVALGESETDLYSFYGRERFSAFTASIAHIEGDLGDLPVPTFDAPDDELIRIYNAWMDAEDWYELWNNANTRLALMPNARELQPGAEKND